MLAASNYTMLVHHLKTYRCRNFKRFANGCKHAGFRVDAERGDGIAVLVSNEYIFALRIDHEVARGAAACSLLSNEFYFAIGTNAIYTQSVVAAV